MVTRDDDAGCIVVEVGGAFYQSGLLIFQDTAW